MDDGYPHTLGTVCAVTSALAALRPELFSALVVLDAPALPPPPVREAFAQMLAGLRTPAYRDVVAATCERMIFLPTDDKARRARLHEGLLATPQAVLVATWKAYDPRDAASRLTLPMLYA